MWVLLCDMWLLLYSCFRGKNRIFFSKALEACNPSKLGSFWTYISSASTASTQCAVQLQIYLYYYFAKCNCKSDPSLLLWYTFEYRVHPFTYDGHQCSAKMNNFLNYYLGVRLDIFNRLIMLLARVSHRRNALLARIQQARCFIY